MTIYLQGEEKWRLNEDYRYNPNDAKNAFNPLNQEARLNLRGTHYQLGDSNEMEKDTTNRRDYIAYPPHNIEIASGRRNYESKIMQNANGKFDGKTIYTTDYTKKPFPREDENLELYLFNKYTKGNQ